MQCFWLLGGDFSLQSLYPSFLTHGRNMMANAASLWFRPGYVWMAWVIHGRILTVAV